MLAGLIAYALSDRWRGVLTDEGSCKRKLTYRWFICYPKKAFGSPEEPITYGLKVSLTSGKNEIGALSIVITPLLLFDSEIRPRIFLVPTGGEEAFKRQRQRFFSCKAF